MALKVVGSNPIIHPINKKDTLWVSFLFMERTGFSHGAFDGTPVGVLAKVTYPGTLHSANFSHPCQKRYLT